MDLGRPNKEYIRYVFKTPEYEKFVSSLNPKVRQKFDYVVDVITTIYNVPTKFIKHLENTDLYEMRVSIGTNEYRTVIFAIDNHNFIEAGNVILLNGFFEEGQQRLS